MADEETIRARRRWFDAYVGHVQEAGTRSYSPDSFSGKFNCPCCGYPTLDERCGWEICYLCNWEDDGQDDHNADRVLSGPNAGYSLTLARENFKRYGNMYTPGNDQRIVAGDCDTESTAKERIIEAFEAMKTASDEGIVGYWCIVNQGREELSRELDRRIEEFEQKIMSDRNKQP